MGVVRDFPDWQLFSPILEVPTQIQGLRILTLHLQLTVSLVGGFDHASHWQPIFSYLLSGFHAPITFV